MVAFLPLLGAVAILGLAPGVAEDQPALTRWRAGEAVAHLDLRLRLVSGGGKLAVGPGPSTEPWVPPPCVADVCQARVDVPGFGPSFDKPHKTELVVALLDRAGIEPFASVAWFFVATGVRVDWTPASMDPSLGATRGGWGNLFLRMRLRIDSWNLPTVPDRTKLRSPFVPVSAPRA